MTVTPADRCPCGTGRTFGECCRPLLARERAAATAEELMRSRFTAHFVKDFEHVHRTYAKTAGEPYVADPEAGKTAWTRLVIHSHETGANPETASVDFSAYYREGEKEQALHEKARFQRIGGAWMYTGPARTGPAPIQAQAKVGRNAPCPCGSGKKSKNCCAR
jgi:SEC-C motif-containing protein